MKKMFASLTLLMGLGLTSAAWAQGGIDYSNLCKWDESAKPRANRDRVVQTLGFSGATTLDGAAIEQQVLPVAGAGVFGTSTIYFDKTAEPAVRVSKGNTITVQPTYRALYWTHFYLYIDYNQDGLFGEDELVSFTHYREGDSGDFHNSVGTVITSGDVYDNGRLPVFTIPETAKTGQTRARFKADWNNKDACGASNLHSNRGTICDFTLEVLAPTAPTTTFKMDVDTQNGTALLYDKATGQVVNPTAVPNGTELELRVTPSEGYRVSLLTVNGEDKLKSLKSGKLPLTAEGGTTNITVQFEKKTYGIFVTKFGAAEGVVVTARNPETLEEIPLMNRLEHGTQIVLSATPPSGYRFSNFIISGEPKLDALNESNNALLITMTRDLRIMFTIEEHRVSMTYHYDDTQGIVTATLEDGTTPVQSGGTVAANSVVFVKVEPREGYEFAGISPKEFPDVDVSDGMEKVSGTEDTYIIEVEDADIEFTVHFRLKQGIEELSALGTVVRPVRGAIVVEGVTAGQVVELYNAAGVRLASQVASEASLSFPADKGVYILKVGKATAKVVVR